MSILDYDFMRYAFAAGAVVGLLAPAVGFFLVQRRMSLIGDGIGHVAFAGVAAGYLLGISPVGTALVAAVIGAIAIEWQRSRHRTAGDQALALLFYTGIAAGVVMISAAGALDANLFGSLRVDPHGRPGRSRPYRRARCRRPGHRVLYRALLAASLDEDGARVAGVPVGLLNVALAALAAVTIAVSMRIVGILLIAALMVLPVIAASRIAWSVRSAILLAMAIGVGSVFAGLTISYYADLAPGGAIVLAAAGCFALAQAAQTVKLRARGGRSPGSGHA